MKSFAVVAGVLLLGANSALAEFSFSSRSDLGDGSRIDTILGISQENRFLAIFKFDGRKHLHDNFWLSMQVRAGICPGMDNRVHVGWRGIGSDGSKSDVEMADFPVTDDRTSVLIGVDTDRASANRLLGTMIAASEVQLRISDSCGTSTDIRLDMSGFRDAAEQFDRSGNPAVLN